MKAYYDVEVQIEEAVPIIIQNFVTLTKKDFIKGFVRISIVVDYFNDKMAYGEDINEADGLGIVKENFT